MSTIHYELTVEESNLVLSGLGELPAKASFNLISKLQQQAAPQLQATQQSSENAKEDQNG